MASKTGLEARGISLVRGGAEALSGVDLDAHAGQVTTIVGPNGAGKTTLLRCLLGLEACAGEVRVEGRVTASMSRAERARVMAYVPQRSSLEAALQVTSVVAIGARHLARSAAEARANEALARVGIEALAERTFNTLSLGEQRRALIARALATGASILLLDEPEAFLDVAQVLHMRALLRALADEGRTLIAVLHDLAEVETLADHVLVLSAGRTAAVGPPDVALTDAILTDVYGVRRDGSRPAFTLG